jgi:hypothetical protein
MRIASNLPTWRPGLAAVAGVVLAFAFAPPSVSASPLEDVRAIAENPASSPSTVALPAVPPAPGTEAPRGPVEVSPTKTSIPAPPPASSTGGRPHLAPTPTDNAPELSTAGDPTPSGEGEVLRAVGSTPTGTDTLEESGKAVADSDRKGGRRASARHGDRSTTRLSISPADVVPLRTWLAHVWPAIAFWQGEKGEHAGGQRRVDIARSLLSLADGTQATAGSAPIGSPSRAENSTTSDERLALPDFSPAPTGDGLTLAFFLFAAFWVVLVAIWFRSGIRFPWSHGQRGPP